MEYTWTDLDKLNHQHYQKRGIPEHRVIANTLDQLHIAFIDFVELYERSELWGLCRKLGDLATAFEQYNAGAADLLRDLLSQFKAATQYSGVQDVVNGLREIEASHPAIFEQAEDGASAMDLRYSVGL